ncbi:MAG TPA: PAS domain-containing protein, partial [Sphingomicrobium sp.]|nr:PAS domain-containing protein [Sphingomicrobium sp.]
MLGNDDPAEGNVKFVDFSAPAARQIEFRDVLEDLPAAIYTTDAAGRITYFNKACIEFSGQTPKIGDEWCVTWKLYTTTGDRLPHSECPMAVALKERRPIRGV